LIRDISIIGRFRMSAVKETTIFMNGRSQSLRIPAEMRLQGTKAKIQKIGSMLIVTESDLDNPFLALDMAQSLISNNFMNEGRDLKPLQDREELE